MRNRVKLYGGETTISRPVLIKVVQDIAASIGCKDKPYIHLDENSILLKGRNTSRMSFNNKGNNPVSKISGNPKEVMKVTDYQDTVADGYENDLQLLKPDSINIFVDKEINMYVKPVMQRRKVQLTIEYSNQDMTFMNALVNNLNNISVYPGTKFYHNLEYVYVLPKVVTALLYSIYKCKSSVCTEKELEQFTLWTYLNQISDDRLTFTIPDTGAVKDLQMSIREVQQSVLGYFTDSIVNLKPEMNESNAAMISLSYSYQYDEVVGFELNYPFLVYNKPIYKEFIRRHRTIPPETHGIFTPYAGALHHSAYQPSILSSPYVTTDYVMVPEYDDVMDNVYPIQYGRMLVSLVVIEKDDLRTLMNIKNFKAFELKGNLMELILKEEREYVTKLNRSFIYIGLYEDGMLKINHPLTLLEDGTLVSDVDLDIKKTYRVGFFLLTDYNKLSDTDFLRFRMGIAKEFKVMKDMINAELYQYDLTHKHLLSSKPDDYYMGIMKIKRKYVSSLETLEKTYNLTAEQRDRIEKAYPDHIGMFFKIMKREYTGIRYVQIYTAVLKNMFDLRKEDKE